MKHIHDLYLEVARQQPGYVKDKLNERLFEKIQELEEKKSQLLKDQKRIAKMKKGGPQKRRQAELEELQMEKQEKLGKKQGKNKKSLDDEQRAIHESYQVLLNEYYMKRSYRLRAVTTEPANDGEKEPLVKQSEELCLLPIKRQHKPSSA